MSKDDNKTVVDDIYGTVNGAKEKADTVAKSTQVINQTGESVKNGVKTFWDTIMFWKKEKTPEEKQADYEKKLKKLEAKYAEEVKKADETSYETVKESVDKHKEIDEKYNKKLAKLNKKYPDEAKKYQEKVIAEAQAQKGADGGEAQVKTGVSQPQAENTPAKEKKTLWQKVTSVFRKKTPEERLEKCRKKLEKAQKQYEKDMKKVDDTATTPAEVNEGWAAAEEKYKKKIEKINKKYPNEVAKIVAEAEAIEKAAAEKAAAEKAAAEKAAAEKAAAEKAAAEKAAAEKAAAEKAAAEKKAAEERAAAEKGAADSSVVREAAEDASNKFNKKVDVKDATQSARGKVAASNEERKMATLKKWMNEVHLPEDNAQKMIDKYGLEMAYKLTQRCMLEPDILMPEIDDKFKAGGNKSSKSIQYFIDMDTQNTDNQAKVSKATGLEFVKAAEVGQADTVAETAEFSQKEAQVGAGDLLPASDKKSNIYFAAWNSNKDASQKDDEVGKGVLLPDENAPKWPLPDWQNGRGK